jgi:UDP-N-acetylmuramate dehydrogenase
MKDLTGLGSWVRANASLQGMLFQGMAGSATYLAEPRSLEELARLVRACNQGGHTLRVLGEANNVLVGPEPVEGVVLRLTGQPFREVTVKGNTVRAGGGASVDSVVAAACKAGLSGLETLVGIPGSVGGALRLNAHDEAGDIGDHVRRVEVVTEDGQILTRERDELKFESQGNNLDDAVIAVAEFELEPESEDGILRLMKRAWMKRKVHQPLRFGAMGPVFQEPSGLNASELITKAGLLRHRVGCAEVSHRDGNYILVRSPANAEDILRLLELIQQRVRERFHVDLERKVAVW